MSDNCTPAECSGCAVECDSKQGEAPSGQCSPSSQDPESFLLKPNKLSRIGKVIGVVSGKGGVGKSLVTALLASAMKRKGCQVGLLDADITGPSVPRIFGVKQRAKMDEMGLYPVKSPGGIDIMSINLLMDNESDPVIWRGPVIGSMVQQFWTEVIWKDLDYLFIDLPPGTGDVALSVFQSIPLDGLVIVTSPQELVTMIVEKSVNMARMMKKPVVGLVENFSFFCCPDCGKETNIYGPGKVDTTAATFGIPAAGSLPLNPEFAQACDRGEVESLEASGLEEIISLLERLPRQEDATV